ncbi:uncharacterized protein LOC121901587 [Scomber scombrus]|uniref:Uncharacterized protein LOC121901587 n=1 Tax=Scomber scombrus TaxID=13677 RepID=A0AAV1QLU2_SCOSC
MYHCAVMDWLKNIWSGTYLSIKVLYYIGNTERTSNYTVVQQPAVSDPVHPGDSVTLQCSVLSDSGNKTCPGGHSVYWFRTGSDASNQDFIYTDGSTPDECDKGPDSLKSCDYHFSKNISSSDAGTYYCAVATCGKILFGNGTKLQIEQTTSYEFTGLVIAVVCLAISMTGNIIFICYRTPRAVCAQFKGIESASLQVRNANLSQPGHESNEDDLDYAGLHFSKRKATAGWKKKEMTDESIYSQVKC